MDGAMAQTAATLRSSLPPGPRGLSALTNVLTFKRDWSGFLRRCQREYGDVVYFRFLNVPLCLVAHPDGIEYVLVKNAGNFEKSRDYRALRALLGNGLLTSEGNFWQAQRKLIQPAFRHENILSYAKLMTEAAAGILEQWRDGETRDVHEDLMGVTLEVVSKSLFGADVSQDTRGVGHAVNTVMSLFIDQANLAFLLPESLPIPKSARLRKSIEHLNGVIQEIIRKRRAHPKPPNDLLQMLLDMQYESGAGMSDEQLRDEVMTLFLAGHETTANSITWTLLLLAQNPEKEAALHEELRAVLQGRPPGASDLPRLAYTEMVVKEALRLYPPAWGIGRRALEEFELDGYRIPAGTNIFMLEWITQRDARFFPEPERFEPERWRDDPTRSGKLPRFAYFPFGGGPRVCVGAGFAMMEATLLLATFAQRFRFELTPGQDLEPLFSVTLRPKQGMKMVVRRQR
jgi:cytochrome P450